LTNLLENSIKYTPSGGKIYISARPYVWEKRDSSIAKRLQVQEERRRRTGESSNHRCNAVMVQVSDTGIGIPPENQQEIFEEFSQVSSNQMDRTGLGLGLAISKRIINAHGGKIWVDSQMNSGSRFTFLLPLSPS
jgi:signal transduction histidine kinase